MARSYTAVYNATMTQSATIAYGTLTATAAVRPKTYEFEIGSDATPADSTAKFTFNRSTAAGTTPAAVTPAPIDPGDPVSISTFSGIWATAPAFTGVLFQFPMNQRATFRWVCAPSKELVQPAAANSGLNLAAPVVNGTPVNYAYTWAFEE